MLARKIAIYVEYNKRLHTITISNLKYWPAKFVYVICTYSI